MKKLLFAFIALLCAHTTNNPRWVHCTRANWYLGGYTEVSDNVCKNTEALTNKPVKCACSDKQKDIDALKIGCLKTLKKLNLKKEDLQKQLESV